MSFFKKLRNTVGDIAKTAVNAVSTPLRMVGVQKELPFTADEYSNKKFGATAQKISGVTDTAGKIIGGAALAATTLGLAAPATTSASLLGGSGGFLSKAGTTVSGLLRGLKTPAPAGGTTTGGLLSSVQNLVKPDSKLGGALSGLFGSGSKLGGIINQLPPAGDILNGILNGAANGASEVLTDSQAAQTVKNEAAKSWFTERIHYFGYGLMLLLVGFLAFFSRKNKTKKR